MGKVFWLRKRLLARCHFFWENAKFALPPWLLRFFYLLKTNAMNARFHLAAFAVIAFSLLQACQSTPFWKDNADPSAGVQWDTVNFNSERYIQALFATEFELYAISENSFARLNSNLEVIERRQLPISNSLPALSDNTFVRLTTNDQNRQVVEFRLARNGDETFRVLVDTLSVPAGNSLDIENLTSSIGAFSPDGTKFLLSGRVLPARHYSLYMFDIQQNFQHNSFVSVKMTKRIDLTDLEDNAVGVIKSIRFLGGNFYVATQQGAWRITAAGAFTKVAEQWKEDSFSWQGNLYLTGTADFDLDKSIDNGLVWERVNVPSELRQVVVADTTIFTQRVKGSAFSVVPSDFKKAKNIVYPPGTDLSANVFYGLVYYNDRYYFSIDKEIYAITTVVTE
jgi:hypothetical protein